MIEFKNNLEFCRQIDMYYELYMYMYVDFTKVYFNRETIYTIDTCT